MDLIPCRRLHICIYRYKDRNIYMDEFLVTRNSAMYLRQSLKVILHIIG